MNINYTLPDETKVRASLRDKTQFGEQSVKFAGTRLVVNKSEIGFFVFNKEIYVFVNNKVFRLEDLTITNIFKEKRLLSGHMRIFEIMNGPHLLIHVEYTAQKNFDVNPFWPTDEEDVDDLLWFAEVLNRHERRLVILETCLEAEKIDA